MRKTCLLLLAVVSTCASASFELGIAVDTYSQRLIRFDMETGTYLGSFGGAAIYNPLAIALNQSANEVYVTGGNKIGRVNFNTGAYNGAITLDDPDIGPLQVKGVTRFQRATSGNLVLTGAFFGTVNKTMTRVYDSAGNFVVALSPIASETIRDAVELNDGTYLSLSSSPSDGSFNNWLNFYDASGNLTSYQSLGVTSSPRYMSMAVNGDSLFLLATDHYSSSKFGYLGAGTVTWVSSVGTNRGGGASIGSAFGHNGMVYSNYTDYSPTLSKYFSNFHALNSDLGTHKPLLSSDIENMVLSDLEIVVAPEPASLVGVALGCSVLIRRKSARR